MAVPTYNTGRDTAVYLDNTPITKSAERLRNDILSADEMRLKKALSDEADFIKAMSVDPVALMTQAGIEQQAADIESYNDKWAKIMSQNRGVMSTDMKIQMQKDRAGLESRQQNLAANQQRALQEMQLYRSNPSKYDSKLFEDSFLNFLSTGEYTTGLTKKRGMLSTALDADLKAYFAAGAPETFGTSEAKKGQIVTTTYTGNEKDGAQRVFNLLVNHEDSDAYLEDAANDFFQQPDEVKMKYLDTDQSGDVSEDEIQAVRDFGDASTIASNPIVRWAMDSYGQRYKKSKITSKNPPSGGSFGMALNIGGKKVPYEVPPSSGARKLSDARESSDWYRTYVDEPQSFPLGTFAKAVVADSELGTSDEVEVPNGTNVDARIVGYARDLDMVELRPTTGVGSIEKVQSILVPRDKIPPALLEGVTIKIGDKIVPIGEGKTAGAKPKAY